MIDARELLTLIESAGYNARDYSGRSMFGKSCIGMTTDNDSVFEALANIIERMTRDVSEKTTEEYLFDASEIVRQARTDAMGRSSIIYWPSVAWPEENNY